MQNNKDNNTIINYYKCILAENAFSNIKEEIFIYINSLLMLEDTTGVSAIKNLYVNHALADDALTLENNYDACVRIYDIFIKRTYGNTSISLDNIKQCILIKIESSGTSNAYELANVKDHHFDTIDNTLQTLGDEDDNIKKYHIVILLLCKALINTIDATFNDIEKIKKLYGYLSGNSTIPVDCKERPLTFKFVYAGNNNTSLSQSCFAHTCFYLLDIPYNLDDIFDKYYTLSAAMQMRDDALEANNNEQSNFYENQMKLSIKELDEMVDDYINNIIMEILLWNPGLSQFNKA
jgi:hypothetical protein